MPDENDYAIRTFSHKCKSNVSIRFDSINISAKTWINYRLMAVLWVSTHLRCQLRIVFDIDFRFVVNICDSCSRWNQRRLPIFNAIFLFTVFTAELGAIVRSARETWNGGDGCDCCWIPTRNSKLAYFFVFKEWIMKRDKAIADCLFLWCQEKFSGDTLLATH